MTDHDVPLTEDQFKTLARFGVPNPETLSKPEASAILADLIERSHARMANYRQVQAAVRLGMDYEEARRMTFDEAIEHHNRMMVANDQKIGGIA